MPKPIQHGETNKMHVSNKEHIANLFSVYITVRIHGYTQEMKTKHIKHRVEHDESCIKAKSVKCTKAGITYIKRHITTYKAISHIMETCTVHIAAWISLGITTD